MIMFITIKYSLFYVHPPEGFFGFIKNLKIYAHYKTESENLNNQWRCFGDLSQNQKELVGLERLKPSCIHNYCSLTYFIPHFPVIIIPV
uniref:Uncharacterized protein n=1 Tax=Rhizophora mucronata TaxID=61149 RepID=A0A2P2Q7H3_RHIMU